MKSPAVYIMANGRNGALYTGATSNLPARAYQHREGLTPGFTAQYKCHLLVWYEAHDEMIAAIAREKQIKAGPRRKKLALIEAMNPDCAISMRASSNPLVIASAAKQSRGRTHRKNWIASGFQPSQ